MTKILCIESSTEICSVVVVDGGEVVDKMEDHSGMNHSRKLTQFIADVLKRNGLKAADLDAIAVSEGPGSYTGLRIGVSAAKGICFAVNKPLIAVSPLMAMADYVLSNEANLGIRISETAGLVPMIDARRMEVYSAIYNKRLEVIEPTSAVVVSETTFASELSNAPLFFFGNGAAKCKEVIQHPNAFFVDGVGTSASHMANIVHRKYERGEFNDVAYFEPYYLKDFIATIPKKNVLGR